MIQPITILIGALGGEGGGVLAEWIVETATQAGHDAQSTSIPGVAQRTGATTYYVEVFPQAVAALAGRRPVLSLLPVPGGVDLALASELLEAGRLIGAGFVSPDRTRLITSTSRTLTTAEKMALGDGRFDSGVLLAVARAQSRALVAFDMEAAARDSGTVVSAVLFGALAASGVLPYPRAAFEAVVDASGRGAQASRRGFARAWDATRADDPRTAATRADRPDPHAAPRGGAHAVDGGARPHDTLEEVVALGVTRMREFQDEPYAELYRQRVARVEAAERAADPEARHAHALARETARFLALWMAFDDIVRVADLKSRASRFARVRRDVGAKTGDIVRIVDHFKPGVPEVASLLPAAFAHRLIAWDRRRQRQGKPPLAVALHLRSDNIGGFVALRVLASLKGMRRRGLRFAQEQALIERWLAAIERAAATDWQCACELALCGRLVKGYGATNERGKRHLAHIVAALGDGGDFATPADRARAIRDAREAALADEGGQALDRALAAHGAAPRPVAAQPIRWTGRRPAAARAGAPR